MKAFAPMKIPFPLVHIDTGHNFPEALAFRDFFAKEIGAELIVRKVEDTIREKNLTEQKGKFARNGQGQHIRNLDGQTRNYVPIQVSALRPSIDLPTNRQRL